MVKWWLPEQTPFTDAETRLVLALYKAHSDCVFRNNCSTAALQQAAGGSRSLPQSIIAALACLGEMHGPIEEAYDFMDLWQKMQPFHEGKYVGGLIPGFGNSFVRGQVDPAFIPVEQILEAQFPRIFSVVKEITEALHQAGKMVYPNPACFSACVAKVLQMPRHLAPMLFIQGRLEAWASVFHHMVKSLTEPKKESEAA